jgi:hypothetical protein
MNKDLEKAPILIFDVTRQPFLSIARHYGGCKAFGYDYFYHPIKDALIRKDYMKQFKKIKDWGAFVEFIKTVKQ